MVAGRAKDRVRPVCVEAEKTRALGDERGWRQQTTIDNFRLRKLAELASTQINLRLCATAVLATAIGGLLVACSTRMPWLMTARAPSLSVCES